MVGSDFPCGLGGRIWASPGAPDRGSGAHLPGSVGRDRAAGGAWVSDPALPQPLHRGDHPVRFALCSLHDLHGLSEPHCGQLAPHRPLRGDLAAPAGVQAGERALAQSPRGCSAAGVHRGFRDLVFLERDLAGSDDPILVSVSGAAGGVGGDGAFAPGPLAGRRPPAPPPADGSAGGDVPDRRRAGSDPDPGRAAIIPLSEHGGGCSPFGCSASAWPFWCSG